jgi:hypothetical protein
MCSTQATGLVNGRLGGRRCRGSVGGVCDGRVRELRTALELKSGAFDSLLRAHDELLDDNNRTPPRRFAFLCAAPLPRIPVVSLSFPRMRAVSLRHTGLREQLNEHRSTARDSSRDEFFTVMAPLSHPHPTTQPPTHTPTPSLPHLPGPLRARAHTRTRTHAGA